MPDNNIQFPKKLKRLATRLGGCMGMERESFIFEAETALQEAFLTGIVDNKPRDDRKLDIPDFPPRIIELAKRLGSCLGMERIGLVLGAETALQQAFILGYLWEWEKEEDIQEEKSA